jgi:hypothetical protein
MTSRNVFRSLYTGMTTDSFIELIEDPDRSQ